MAVGGLAPTLWGWRRIPVRRWFVLGAAVGVTGRLADAAGPESQVISDFPVISGRRWSEPRAGRPPTRVPSPCAAALDDGGGPRGLVDDLAGNRSDDLGAHRRGDDGVLLEGELRHRRDRAQRTLELGVDQFAGGLVDRGHGSAVRIRGEPEVGVAHAGLPAHPDRPASVVGPPGSQVVASELSRARPARS